MKKYVNGQYIEMTAEEIAAMQSAAEAEERAYWQNADYGEVINAEIRKRYTASQEFAILRQRGNKLDEYADYYAYCEECKTLVREKMAAAGRYVNVE